MRPSEPRGCIRYDRVDKSLFSRLPSLAAARICKPSRRGRRPQSSRRWRHHDGQRPGHHQFHHCAARCRRAPTGGCRGQSPLLRTRCIRVGLSGKKPQWGRQAAWSACRRSRWRPRCGARPQDRVRRDPARGRSGYPPSSWHQVGPTRRPEWASGPSPLWKTPVWPIAVRHGAQQTKPCCRAPMEPRDVAGYPRCRASSTRLLCGGQQDEPRPRGGARRSA
jgi:hypothetical protein